MDLLLAIVGLVLVNVAWLAYLAAIPPEKVPRRPAVHSGVMVLGVVLALVGVIRPFLSTAPFPLIPLILVLLTVVLSGFFFYLLTIASLPDGERVVHVGDPLPPFEAQNDTGWWVRSQDWGGQRILLKFFRGHW